MSIPLASAEKNRFISQRHKANIQFSPISGESFNITESDILSLKINRSCMSSNKIGIGEVMANELEIELFNGDGRFDDVVFEGGELFVRVYVYGSPLNYEIINETIGINSSMASVTDEMLILTDANASVEEETLCLINPITIIPYGYYTVDNAPKKSATIKLTALDRMVLFDKPFVYGGTFPVNIYTLYDSICTYCNVAKDTTSFVNFANYNYSINEFSENTTCRQILSWICEILGVNAYFNVNGRLVLGWYQSVQESITMSNVYEYDIDENTLTVTGVIATIGDTEYVQGSDEYRIAIADNPLMNNNIQSAINNIASKVVGFSYLPFSADTVPMVWLLPMDVITLVNGDVSYTVIISDTLYTMNGKLALQGKGETAKVESYASLNPLTNKERAIIRSLEENNNATLNERVQSAIAFNETISGAFGLFTYKEQQADGSYKYYLHNKQNINDSSIIFGFTSGGYAWTNNWNNGNPTWTYGVTSDGNALFKMLSAEGINVSKSGEQYSVDITPTQFRIRYGNTVVTSIERDEMSIPKIKTTDYYQLGNVRISPYYVGDSMNGINFVFVE